jgi:hypothetical protein
MRGTMRANTRARRRGCGFVGYGLRVPPRHRKSGTPLECGPICASATEAEPAGFHRVRSWCPRISPALRVMRYAFHPTTRATGTPFERRPMCALATEAEPADHRPVRSWCPRISQPSHTGDGPGYERDQTATYSLRRSSALSPACRRIAWTVPSGRSPGCRRTVVRALVAGFHQISWLPFACRSNTKPARLSFPMTSSALSPESLPIATRSPGYGCRPLRKPRCEAQEEVHPRARCTTPRACGQRPGRSPASPPRFDPAPQDQEAPCW